MLQSVKYLYLCSDPSHADICYNFMTLVIKTGPCGSDTLMLNELLSLKRREYGCCPGMCEYLMTPQVFSMNLRGHQSV